MTKKLIIATIAVLFCFNATAQTGSTPFLLKNNNVVLDNTVPRAGMPGIVKFRLDSGIYEDNTNGSWVIFAKMAYTYNDAENLTEYIFYYRNQETNIWEEENSTQYIYDDNERVVEEIENVWNNGEWWPQVKIEYYYDANDNVIEEIEYEWDGADEAWYEIFKMEYVYESGTLMEELEYEWDDVEQSWFTVWKTEYIYTTNRAKNLGMNTMVATGYLPKKPSTATMKTTIWQWKPSTTGKATSGYRKKKPNTPLRPMAIMCFGKPTYGTKQFQTMSLNIKWS